MIRSLTADLDTQEEYAHWQLQPAYLVVRDTDIAKSRHIGWVAIHDMKFTISILYLPR